MSPLEQVLERLEGVKRSGTGYRARCPVAEAHTHDDRKPSLSVSEGRDGRALVHCHTGCELPDVLDALGLEYRDLFADDAKPWTLDGLRRTGASAELDGRWRLGGTRYMPAAVNGTPKALAAKGATRDLFPDPAAVPGDTLFVVEGEPDAVTGASLGLPTVAVPGAGKWQHEWAARLAEGRQQVVVIPDADETGRKAAQRIAAALAEHCADVRILDLEPGRVDGADLSDWAGDAHDEVDRACARDLLLKVAREAPRVGIRKAAETTRYAGRVLDVGALLAEPDTPVPWRCDRLAADGYLTVLAGRGGEGKSWLALALACGVARGEGAAGIPCRRGRALIFDAENGPKLIARRFRAGEVTPDLAVQPVDAGGLRLGDDLDWFRQTIEAHGANLVVFDSLRVLSSGVKESDSDEMEPIITRLKQLARDTGAAVILIHHRGKSEVNDYRGSSVILDQTDLLFTLGRAAGDPEGRHRRKVTTVKCRVDEEAEPRWVAIEADRSRGLVFINEAEPYESEDAGRPRDHLRERVLDLLTGESQSRARIAIRLGRDKSDQTVRRVLVDLEAEGFAEQRPDGWARAGGGHPDHLGSDHPDHPPENGFVEPKQGWSPELTPDHPSESRGRR